MTDHNSKHSTSVTALMPSRPFVFLFFVLVSGLFFFAVLRLIFLSSYTDRVAGVPALTVLESFGVGVRFDLIVILFIFLPLILILPWLAMKYKAVRTAVTAYLSLLFAASFLGMLADISFYKVFDSRLNFQAIEYLSGGRTTWHLILNEPKFYLMLVIWLIISVAFALSVVLIIRRTRRLPHHRSWAVQGGWFVIALALAFLGIRGRVKLSPIDWGAAYISQNQFVNQLGLNGIYTFGRAFMEEGHDPRLVYLPESERFSFVPFADALDTVQSMIGLPGDRWVDPEHNLKRNSSQPDASFGFNPNVVVVMMESFSGRNVGALGSTFGLTPEFDSLASHGILFTDFYGCGTRTNFGLAATLCSYPSLPGRSVMSRYNVLHPFRCLAEILHDRGYYNVYAYGGDLGFDNMEGFFREEGYDRFCGDDYFGLENVYAKWGIPDEIVFDKVIELTDSLPRPFQLTIMTLSNHEPFDLPDSSVQVYFDDDEDSNLLNSMRYADFALGRFIDSVSQLPLFDSTIFVFVSDHAHWGRAELTADPVNFNIPLLFYSPALLGTHARRMHVTGSQVDVLPTLMSLLGGDYEQESWGRNLFAIPENDSGFAIISVRNWLEYIEGDHFFSQDVARPGQLMKMTGWGRAAEYTVVEDSVMLDRFRRRLHRYTQIADQLSTPGAVAKSK